MSRQQQESQGVVLTGYHSNAELLPKAGPCAPSCAPGQDPQSTVTRWDTPAEAQRCSARCRSVCATGHSGCYFPLFLHW